MEILLFIVALFVFLNLGLSVMILLHIMSHTAFMLKTSKELEDIKYQIGVLVKAQNVSTKKRPAVDPAGPGLVDIETPQQTYDPKYLQKRT